MFFQGAFLSFFGNLHPSPLSRNEQIKMNKMKNGSIALSDLNKLDIRVGTIIEVRSFPEAKTNKFQVFVNFGGNIGVLRSSTSQPLIEKRESLIGQQVMAIVNLLEENDSECFILGSSATESKPPILIQPQHYIKNGLKVC